VALHDRGGGRRRGIQLPLLLGLLCVQRQLAADESTPLLSAVPVEGGVRVSARAGEAWSLELRPSGFGVPGAIRPLELGAATSDGSRLESSSAQGLQSWYVLRADGILHGFSISALPDPKAEDPSLAIEIALSGDLTAKLCAGAQRLDLFLHGAAVLRYGILRAEDADGLPLPARIEPSGNTGLRLVLERTSRALPLTLETLLRPARAEDYAGGQGAAGLAAPEAAPANDTCAGAQTIPAAGPFPYLSAVVDVADATITGDPLVRPSCAVPGRSLSRSVWFAFTPAENDTYTFATCSEMGTGTTLDDPLLAIYTASAGCGGTYTEVAGACDDDGCDQEQFQSSVTAQLVAGTTYYIVAWNSGGAPTTGNTSLGIRVSRPSPPPANDTCEGGSAAPYVVPSAGPFPALTGITADITGASSSGDPPSPSCLASGFTASRSVWYTFTPAASGTYAISSCALDLGGTATTVNDTLIGIYTAAGGCAGPFTEIPSAGTVDGCDDDYCDFEGFQARVATSLSAGTTYHIVVFKVGAAAPAPGNTAVQLRVDRVDIPTNDVCGTATPVFVDVPLNGSTELAFHDYLVSAASECLSGVGQATSTALSGLGPDVAYEFTAPESAAYSFKVTGYSSTNDLIVYVAADCPAGPLPAAVSCLAGANRSTIQPSEEAACLPLEAGARVWVYVDGAQASPGSRFVLEVNHCTPEAEPNDTTAQAGALACGLEGTQSPAGDVDFFSVGTYPPLTRVFAMVDGVAANTTDFDLRVTTANDTLEYDDLNDDVPFGALSPVCAGTPLPATPVFLRTSMFSSILVAEPYRLYAVVQPRAGAAASEVEPNDSIAQATQQTDGYVAGSLSGDSPSTDLDLYQIDAVAGDLILLALDGDPGRTGAPLNARISLLDEVGLVLATVDDRDGSSWTATGVGSLTSLTPRSPGEGLTWRARHTGRYYAKVEAGGADNTPRAGNYLLSMTRNCRSLADLDGDGVANAEDCAPADPTIYAVPAEISGVSFSSDKTTLSWTDAGQGPSVGYEVLRGSVGSLPVGPGGGDETCSQVPSATSWSDPLTPVARAGFWYLVRAENACGSGPWGFEGRGGIPTGPRVSGTCP